MVRLEIWKSFSEGACQFELRGEVDLATIDRLRDALLSAVREDLDITIDMRFIDFIGSAGMSVILHTVELLRNRGRSLSISAASRPVARVLDLLGVQYLLQQPASMA